jgi:hypothetical protein
MHFLGWQKTEHPSKYLSHMGCTLSLFETGLEAFFVKWGRLEQESGGNAFV